MDSTITDLTNSRGVPPNQLVLGIPFYGIGYPSVPIEGANFGLYEVPAPETASTVAVPYNQIPTQFNEKTSIKRCDIGRSSGVVCPQSWGNPLYVAPTSGSQETWIYDSGNAYGFGPSVVTFDDMGSMAAKVKYAFGKELRGVMIWQLTQDTADHVLLNTIVKCMPKPVYSSDRSSISSVFRFQ